ncbi:MAG: hypothetical protein PHG85_06290 [Candidatus Altiarchaeota archaeon]|nr:hypothetical protein [Candidatus Altiarchaeota archaeon]
MEASEIGLLFLAAAWFIQMLYILRGRKEMQKLFLIPYLIGSVILVLDGYDNGTLTNRAYQNLVILSCALIILLKTGGKHRK